MKKLMFVALPVIGLGVIGIFAFSAQETCSAGTDCTVSNSPTNTNQQSEELSIASIKEDLANGAILIDVRTSDEFTTEHAVGSLNLPVEQISSGEFPKVDKDTTIYVYCRSGKRANTALEAMKKSGFTNVKSITSLDNWKSLGGKTQKS